MNKCLLGCVRVTSLVMIAVILSVSGCKTSGAGNTGDNAASLSDSANAVISFSKLEHEFGKVNEGEKIGCIFTFENHGSAPLVINRAVTSCGCTVPEYDRKPVAPGASGKLEVVFNTSGYEGVQTKTISVHSNATIPVVILKINAEVITN